MVISIIFGGARNIFASLIPRRLTLSQRRMAGDLSYYRVETLEGSVLHVTGTPIGFFVNRTTDAGAFDPTPATSSYSSRTMWTLLHRASPAFRKAYQQVWIVRIAGLGTYACLCKLCWPRRSRRIFPHPTTQLISCSLKPRRTLLRLSPQRPIRSTRILCCSFRPQTVEHLLASAEARPVAQAMFRCCRA